MSEITTTNDDGDDSYTKFTVQYTAMHHINFIGGNTEIAVILMKYTYVDLRVVKFKL